MMAQTSVALSWHNEYFLPSLFVSSTNAVHRLTHAALIGSDGDDFPSQAPKSGWCRAVWHALWAATTAVSRRRAAQAAPQGCLAADFSLEDHRERPVAYSFSHLFITWCAPGRCAPVCITWGRE